MPLPERYDGDPTDLPTEVPTATTVVPHGYEPTEEGWEEEVPLEFPPAAPEDVPVPVLDEAEEIPFPVQEVMEEPSPTVDVDEADDVGVTTCVYSKLEVAQDSTNLALAKMHDLLAKEEEEDKEKQVQVGEGGSRGT